MSINKTYEPPMELIKTFRKVDFNQYKYAYDKDAILAWKNRKRELDVETLRALMYGFTFTKEYYCCPIKFPFDSITIRNCR